MEDETRALHYYQEAYQLYPVNLDVICWLGTFFVKYEQYEKAIPFFEIASKLHYDDNLQWELMIASCLR